MQWIIGQGLGICLVIYIGYWSAVDSPQWNIESTLELDFEEANTPMGPNSLFFELIYHDGIVYKGWIDLWFTLVHKGVLVIA